MGVHLLEFPSRIDMHQGKGRRCGMECLARQVQHDRRVLPDGVQHDRVSSRSNGLPDDFYGFCFKGGHRSVRIGQRRIERGTNPRGNDESRFNLFVCRMKCSMSLVSRICNRPSGETPSCETVAESWCACYRSMGRSGWPVGQTGPPFRYLTSDAGRPTDVAETASICAWIESYCGARSSDRGQGVGHAATFL